MNEHDIRNKSFSQAKDRQKILRKTVIYEKIEKPFTTEPTLRIRRGHNITIRRCYFVASMLKRMGFNEGNRLTRTDLENACDRVPGMDHRTHNRYIGFCIYSKGKQRRLVKIVKGYLERLRIIYRVGNGFFKVSFAGVPVEYLVKGSKHTITNLCVLNGRSGSHKVGMEKELVAPTTNNEQQQQHNTHTNQSSESIHIEAYSKHTQFCQFAEVEGYDHNIICVRDKKNVGLCQYYLSGFTTECSRRLRKLDLTPLEKAILRVSKSGGSG